MAYSRFNGSLTGDSPSWHILEEDVVAELQRLLGLRRPGRGLRHGGRVVVRGAAGGIWHLAGDHLVSGDLRLGELAERDRLRATQVGDSSGRSCSSS